MTSDTDLINAFGMLLMSALYELPLLVCCVVGLVMLAALRTASPARRGAQRGLWLALLGALVNLGVAAFNGWFASTSADAPRYGLMLWRIVNGLPFFANLMVGVGLMLVVLAVRDALHAATASAPAPRVPGATP